MNNEPVAWKVIETDDEGSFTTFTEVEPVWADNAIPLYTHPVKTLTMAEMEDFINAYGMDIGDRYEFTFAQLTKMIVEIEANIRGEK